MSGRLCVPLSAHPGPARGLGPNQSRGAADMEMTCLRYSCLACPLPTPGSSQPYLPPSKDSHSQTPPCACHGNHPESSLLHPMHLLAPHPALTVDVGPPALTVGLPQTVVIPWPVYFQPLHGRGPGTGHKLRPNRTNIILENADPLHKMPRTRSFLRPYQKGGALLPA